jgi:hypothetical protein
VRVAVVATVALLAFVAAGCLGGGESAEAPPNSSPPARTTVIDFWGEVWTCNGPQGDLYTSGSDDDGASPDVSERELSPNQCTAIRAGGPVTYCVGTAPDCAHAVSTDPAVRPTEP